MAINFVDASGNAHETKQIYFVDGSKAAHALLGASASEFPAFCVRYLRNASGVTGSMPDEYRTVGTSLPLTACAFGLTGHHITGWSGSDGASYSDGQSVSGEGMNAVVLALSAQWEANAYTVRFDPNGASDGATADLPMTYGVAKELPACGFTRSFTVTLDWGEGSGSATELTGTYGFNSWDTQADGNGTDYQPGQSVQDLTTENNAVVTLYPIWEGGAVSLPTTGTRDKYSFLGWSLADGAEEPSFTTTYTPTADVVLHAVWKKLVPSHANLADYSVSELSEVSRYLEGLSSSELATDEEYQRWLGFVGSQFDFGAYKSGSTLYSSTSNAQDKRLKATLVGVLHDNRADGTGKVGLSFLTLNALPYAYQMNGSNTNSGGWSGSKMRTTLNSGEVFTSLPEALSSALVPVSKMTNNTGNTSATSAVTATSDKVWLPSVVEVYGETNLLSGWGMDSYVAMYKLEGSQYKFFKDKSINFKSYSAMGNITTTNSGAAYTSHQGSLGTGYVWLRSPYAGYSGNFMLVGSSGSSDGSSASRGYGVGLGFSL